MLTRPESSPAYLERCVEAFVDALHEADALAHAGNVGPELSDVLRFAADLVSIIAEGLDGHSGGDVLLADVETLRRMFREAQGLLVKAVPLH